MNKHRKEEENYRRPAEYAPQSSLSEANLKKLTAATKTPPIPRRRSSIKAKKKLTPSNIPSSVPRKRAPRPHASTFDDTPVAYATSIGLKGGKVGAVQKGSAAKANKILGDEVLRVAEPEMARGGWFEFPLPPNAFTGDNIENFSMVGLRYSRDSSIWTRTESEGAVWVIA
jgi:hypothetical protein